MSRTALVTGATGFIGGHLVRRLLNDGWQVHAVVVPGPAPLPEGAIVHVHDGETASLVSILGEASPDVVFHLASVYLAKHEPEDIEPLVRSNVLFGAQLLGAMAAAGSMRVVNVGTGWQHFSGEAYDPVNLYAATKQAFEDVARYYTSARGLRMATVRLYDTYGPHDPRPKLMPLLLRASRTGERLELSPGEQQLYLVHVDDIVDALLAAAELLAQPGPAQADYAVATPEPLTVRQLVALVERVTGERLDVEWGARPYREREVLVPWIGERLPGWTPKTRLEDGLREMLAQGSDGETR